MTETKKPRTTPPAPKAPRAAAQAAKTPRPAPPASTPVPRSVVREYLTALRAPRPRGRPVDLDALRTRLDATEDPLEKLALTQKILDSSTSTAPSLVELESMFVEVAAAYAAGKNISWAAWREMGVPAPVLRRAGITR